MIWLYIFLYFGIGTIFANIIDADIEEQTMFFLAWPVVICFLLFVALIYLTFFPFAWIGKKIKEM